MQILLNNLQFSATDHYLINHCRDTFKTFEECINYLKKEAVRREDMATQLGKRNAKRSTRSVNNEVGIEDLVAICNTIGIEPTLDSVRSINRIQSDDFSIPSRSWRLLVELFGKEGMEKFIQKRKEARELVQGSTSTQTQSSSRPNKNKPPIVPRQYQKESSVNITQLDSDGEDDDSDESDEGTIPR